MTNLRKCLALSVEKFTFHFENISMFPLFIIEVIDLSFMNNPLVEISEARTPREQHLCFKI